MALRRPTRSAGRRLFPDSQRDLTGMTVTPEDSLLVALRVIDRAGVELAFVRDARGRITGTLSDGDARRALLRGVPLDGPNGVRRAMHKDFTWVGPHVGRAEVLDLMRSLGIGQIPVLDASRALVGLHLLHELIGAVERPNCAIIMAGGQGLRLRPLTQHVPKPMLPVAGRPILERLVLHLVGYGVREIYLSINYLGPVIESHFGDGARFGCRIRYLREDKPLGTGGALGLLPAIPTHPVLVMNGDLITQADLGRLLGFHADGGFAATICLRPHQVDIPFGVADVQGDRLVGLREKPTEQHLVNAGIYVVSPATLALVPREQEFPITSLFEKCLDKRLPVGAHVLEGDWIDVGRHDALKQARGQ